MKREKKEGEGSRSLRRHMRPSYGYYALPIFAFLSVVSLAIGALVAVLLQRGVGLLIIGFGGYLIVTYVVSMLVTGQTRPSTLPARMVDMLGLRGDEKVLDVGCGLGKTSIAVAKLLREGRVIGVDIWDKMEIPGNSPDGAFANAEIEGVQDKVDFKTGNVLALPFPDDSFDLVTATSVINNLHTEGEKTKALNEILRVLRAGGKLLLWEPLRDFRGFVVFSPFGFLTLLPCQKWIDLLRKARFTNLEYSYMRGMGAFVVQKPLQV